MSIFWKQFVPSLIIVILALLLLTVIVIVQLNKFDRLQTEKDLVHAGDLVISVLEPLFESGDTRGIQPAVARLGEKSGIRITVMDKEDLPP